jgi:predicted permease
MEILNIVLPVFLVIGLGYGLRILGFLRPETGAALSKLVFYVAAPALLFRSASQTPLQESLNLRVLLVVAAVTGATALVVYLVCARNAPSRRGVLAQGSHRSNMVFVGMPIVANAFGEQVIGQVAVLIGFMVMFYNFLAVLLLTLPHQQRSARSASVWLRTASVIAKNPLILSIASGILVRLSHLSLLVSLDQTLELVGRTAMPVALIAVGAGLELGRLREEFLPSMLTAAVKLIVYPAVILAGLRSLGIEGVALQAPVLVMASPTAVVSYVMAKEMNGDEKLAAAIIIGSTITSLVTCTGWLLFFHLG